VIFSFAIALSAADHKLTCAECHREQSQHFAQTGMARALEPAAHGVILGSHKTLTFAQGDYQYAIERDGDTSWYRVFHAREEFKAKIGWAFGLGAAGQTYLFQRNGVWQEGR